MAKIKLEDIRQELSADGWKVLSEEYKNLDTEMIFECNHGHRVFAPWKKLRTKRECPICKQKEHVTTEGEIIAKPKGARRVLALDQSSKITGYAIYDDSKLVKYGTFSTTYNEDIDRFMAVRDWLVSMIQNWRPDHIGLEGIQFQEESAKGQAMGVTVFQTLARLQGILMMVCHDEGIPFEVCPTNTWRHSCGVKGKTRTDKKRSMQLLVQHWYDVKVSEDEADAIGIGRHLAGFVQKNLLTTNWET